MLDAGNHCGTGFGVSILAFSGAVTFSFWLLMTRIARGVPVADELGDMNRNTVTGANIERRFKEIMFSRKVKWRLITK